MTHSLNIKRVESSKKIIPSPILNENSSSKCQYGSVYRNILDNYEEVGGVVPSVQINLGDLRDAITKGPYLPLISFKFYPDHT